MIPLRSQIGFRLRVALAMLFGAIAPILAELIEFKWFKLRVRVRAKLMSISASYAPFFGAVIAP
jgi:hypothetical protein